MAGEGTCESARGHAQFNTGDKADILSVQHIALNFGDAECAALKTAVWVLRCSSVIDAATAALKAGNPAGLVREYLDCAAYAVKAVLEIAPQLQGEASLSGENIFVDAAAVLTASMAECAKAAGPLMPPAELCEWERSLFGIRVDDELVRLTGVCLPTPPAAGDASRRDALVTSAAERVAAAVAPPVAGSDQSDPQPQPPQVCQSPLAPAARPTPVTMEMALPQMVAVAKDTTVLCAAVQDLKVIKLRPAHCAGNARLPPCFDLAEWTCDMHPAIKPYLIDAVAKVARAIEAVLDLQRGNAAAASKAKLTAENKAAKMDDAAQSANPPPPPTQPSVEQRHGSKQDRHEVAKPVAPWFSHTEDYFNADMAVKTLMAAKDGYCKAVCFYVMKCSGYSTFTLLDTVFKLSMTTGVPDTVTPAPQITGRCPVRSSVIAATAAFLGVCCKPAQDLLLDDVLVEQTSSDRCGWWELESKREHCADVVRLKDEMRSQRILLDKCRVCGRCGNCVIHRGVVECNVKVGDHPQPLEKKAHIIPHAAWKLLETALLLRRCDKERFRNIDNVGEYLTGAHNVLFMSTCIEALFTRGVLGFVKVGPPECEFYRVRVARDKARELIDFGGDFQLRSLLTRPEAFRGPGAAVVGLLDGLIVDLTRPARATEPKRKGAEEPQALQGDVPRINHRYLELHARTRGITDLPQLRELTEEALAQRPSRSDTDSNTYSFVLQWLRGSGLPPQGCDDNPTSTAGRLVPGTPSSSMGSLPTDGSWTSSDGA